MNSDNVSWAVALLRGRADQMGRTPRRADFSPQEVSRIKSILGPWPRALEKAGLKQPAPPTKKACPHPRKRRQMPAGQNGGRQEAAREHNEKGENIK